MTEETNLETSGREALIRGGSATAAMALALVALADFLFWAPEPGLNLFAYGVAVAAGIVLLAIRWLPVRTTAIALGVCLVAALPLLETPSVPGLLLAAGGLALVALTVSSLLPRSFEDGRVPSCASGWWRRCYWLRMPWVALGESRGR